GLTGLSLASTDLVPDVRRMLRAEQKELAKFCDTIRDACLNVSHTVAGQDSAKKEEEAEAEGEGEGEGEEAEEEEWTPTIAELRSFSSAVKARLDEKEREREAEREAERDEEDMVTMGAVSPPGSPGSPGSPSVPEASGACETPGVVSTPTTPVKTSPVLARATTNSGISYSPVPPSGISPNRYDAVSPRRPLRRGKTAAGTTRAASKPLTSRVAVARSPLNPSPISHGTGTRRRAQLARPSSASGAGRDRERERKSTISATPSLPSSPFMPLPMIHRAKGEGAVTRTLGGRQGAAVTPLSMPMAAPPVRPPVVGRPMQRRNSELGRDGARSALGTRGINRTLSSKGPLRAINPHS
ncbi:hypothetical protein KIPB_009938, partial [Kipferlia bialata]